MALKNSKMLNQLLDIIDRGHTFVMKPDGLFIDIWIGKDHHGKKFERHRQLPREKMYDSKIQENIDEMLEELHKDIENA